MPPNNNTPIIYVYLLIRIKEHNKTLVTDTKELKEVIGRTLIRSGGLPRIIIKYIIKDLVTFNILKKINCNSYQIREHPQEKNVRLLVNYL
jgi:hypothetical protein